MKKIILLILLFQITLKAQDTFSILAFDSITGEVGAAGASCVDLFPFPFFSNHFIAELFPGQGAIATQASYLSTNQQNANYRMLAGDSPTQIINWLSNNDVGANASIRQYGVVRMMSGSQQSAAFTGSNCMNYKGHIVGDNYTIHGNILSGAMVLDSMEARFKREKGDLACKLMAALQGANIVGADSRCAVNGTSSLFAFVKVTQTNDTFGNPSFLQSLKTANGAGIEPIDSLQKLFDSAHNCFVDETATKKNKGDENLVEVFPVPANSELVIKLKTYNDIVAIVIRNSMGQKIFERSFNKKISLDVSSYQKGIYLAELLINNQTVFKKFTVQ